MVSFIVPFARFCVGIYLLVKFWYFVATFREAATQAVLTSTNNLCFGAKNKKNRYYSFAI